MEDSGMLLVGFPAGNRMVIYSIIGQRVRTVYKIDVRAIASAATTSAASELICGCPVFRHESKCDHVELCCVALTAIRSDGVVESDEYDPSEWRKHVFVHRPKLNDTLIIRPEWCPPMGLAAFVSAAADNSFPAADVGVDERLGLSALRAQCASAEKMAILIDDPGVVSEANSESAVSSEPVEDDPDEDLTISTPVAASDTSWERKRPSESVFYVDREVWKSVLYTIHNGGNVLLLGPSGSGKTELAYLAAQAFGVPLEAFACGAMSEPRSTLIGNTHYNSERGTWFQESRFVRAMRDSDSAGGVVLLDELTRAVRSAFNILMPLLDQQRYLALDESETGEVIRRGDRVSVIATANIGIEYSGTEAMDKALQERFSFTIEMAFPPAKIEQRILVRRCPGLSEKDAKLLVSAAVRQRHMAVVDNEFNNQISTRMLLAAGQAIAAGFSFNSAVRFAIEGCFSAEGADSSERAGIQRIFQKGA